MKMCVCCCCTMTNGRRLMPNLFLFLFLSYSLYVVLSSNSIHCHFPLQKTNKLTNNAVPTMTSCCRTFSLHRCIRLCVLENLWSRKQRLKNWSWLVSELRKQYGKYDPTLLFGSHSLTISIVTLFLAIPFISCFIYNTPHACIHIQFFPLLFTRWCGGVILFHFHIFFSLDR